MHKYSNIFFGEISAVVNLDRWTVSPYVGLRLVAFKLRCVVDSVDVSRTGREKRYNDCVPLRRWKHQRRALFTGDQYVRVCIYIHRSGSSHEIHEIYTSNARECECECECVEGTKGTTATASSIILRWDAYRNFLPTVCANLEV